MVAQVVQAAIVKEFGYEHWEAMDWIIRHESNYDLNAINPNSLSCGLAQSLPCSKVKGQCPDMEMNCQINWMINYIKNRYQTPTEAMIFKKRTGWY